MALDPNTYGKYKQVLTVDIQGVDVVWSDVPGFERTRILPVINGVAADLRQRYDASLKVGGDYFHLVAKHKRPPDPSDVLVLKSIVCGLLEATSWGGPG